MITNDRWAWAAAAAAQGMLPVPTASDREAWSAVASSGHAATVLADARADATAAWPATTASAWLRFTRDGDREEYETAVFAKHAMLGRAVVLAACDPSEAAFDHVADGVIAFCEQSSWCWPAHDDSRTRHERLPDVDRPYLDLGAGEVAAALAWTFHVLGDQLEAHAPGLSRRVRAEISRRVLVPFVERDDWHWLGYHDDAHNWLAWICGNVATAALVFEDDELRRAAILDRALAGLQRYADSLPDDGAIDEGSSYWWNGACRALEALELLEHASGGAVTAWRDHPALRATIRFPGAMHLGHDWIVSVADATARASRDSAWHALRRLATSIDDQAGVAYALAHRGEQANSAPERLGRLLSELHDDAWWADGPHPGSAASPGTFWYPSVELLVAHAREPGGLSLVAKGGHNDENHNHNDVGSVIVALDGVPVVIDPGRTTYTAKTFSPDRYDIWAMQSTWHSVPTIAGHAQSQGRAFAATDVTAHDDADGAALTLDLRDAYGVPGLASWTRTAALTAAGVTLTDRWRFDALPHTPSEIALILAGEVVLATPTRLEVTPVEGRGRVALISRQPWSLATRDLADPMLSTIWGERIVRATLDVGRAPEDTSVVTIEVVANAEEGEA